MLLSKHIGNILLKMSRWIQFPKVIFLFQVGYKCCFAISMCMERADSEIGGLLLTEKQASLNFANPIRYMLGKENRLKQKLQRTQLFLNPELTFLSLFRTNDWLHTQQVCSGFLYCITLYCAFYTSFSNKLEILTWR